MYRYALLNTVVIGVVAIIITVLRRKNIVAKRLLIVVLALVLLTLIFDNILISVGFFFFSPEHITGIKIYKLPIEDLDYAFVSAVLMPILWEALNKTPRKKSITREK